MADVKGTRYKAQSTSEAELLERESPAPAFGGRSGAEVAKAAAGLPFDTQGKPHSKRRSILGFGGYPLAFFVSAVGKGLTRARFRKCGKERTLRKLAARQLPFAMLCLAQGKKELAEEEGEG